jgi:hypothetical protein
LFTPCSQIMCIRKMTCTIQTLSDKRLALAREPFCLWSRQNQR